ncbi:MAG: thiamine-phosphate kinase [Geothermobacteraceae bacterium]
MTDEFELIERIRALAPSSTAVTRGIGDDCAELEIPAGERLLVTTDMLLEGVHFRRDWTGMRDLGHKSAAVNLSDLAAMGATPLALTLGLGVPGDVAEADIDEFIAGFCAAAGRYGVPLVGGDTCRAQQFLAVSVTAMGTAAPEAVVGRGGARPGDVLLVSGTLGDSALALELLRRGQTPPDDLARRHHRPEPRLELGRRLAVAGVHAMIDISDGLLGDLGHILKASGCGAELETARLPLSGTLWRYLADDPALLDLALSGGEDYELLLAAEPGQVERLLVLAEDVGVPLAPVGRCTDDAGGLWLIEADGRRHLAKPGGFRHRIGRADSAC